MTRDFRVRKAIHIGRDHLTVLKNRQDFVSVFDGYVNSERTIIGVICDGCSDGAHTEIGASLVSFFVSREAIHLLSKGVPKEVVPELLYPETIKYLDTITNAHHFCDDGDKAGFVNDFLLSTIIGFILTPESTVVFTAGDGTIVVNETIAFIDSENRPMYLAYHLVNPLFRMKNASVLPSSFEVNVYSTSEIYRLAIGSDAWTREKDKLSEVWGFEHPAELQRKMNRWSRKEHRFGDDVSIITVEAIDLPERDSSDASNDRGEADKPSQG